MSGAVLRDCLSTVHIVPSLYCIQELYKEHTCSCMG